MSRSEQLAKASKDLMLSAPMYGLYLITLNKMWDNKAVPTAGVGLNGINFHLYLNEEFWDKLKDVQRKSLIQHEVGHIMFFHLTDFEHLTDNEIANIAEDITINGYLKEDELPPGPQLAKNFPELNLEERKGTNYYYEKLLQAKKNKSCPNLNSILEAKGQGKGTCQIQIPKQGTVEVRIPDHSTWGEIQGKSEVEKKLIKTQTEHVFLEVAEQVEKSCGSVPGEFAELLKRIRNPQPPKFNWRRYLRMFIGGSEDTYSTISRRKENFRFHGLPGIKHKPKQHILVAIDTSGSVSTKELKEFMNEIYHMHKTGTEVTIIQCDVVIKSIKKFDPKMDIEVHGRKGTLFDPPVAYFNEHLNNFCCLIYLTDGEGSTPPPAKGKMLWVFSSQSEINHDLIGSKIKLN